MLYMMGLGQGNSAAPPSWIQLRAVMVTIFKQLNLGATIKDPMSDETINLMGVLFVDNTDLYTWKEEITDSVELWHQTQTVRELEPPIERDRGSTKIREMFLVPT